MVALPGIKCRIVFGLPGGVRGVCVSWKVMVWTDTWVTIFCVSSSTMV